MRSFVQVDPGDPHNDQMLAMTEEDLLDHMQLVNAVLLQGQQADAPLSAMMAALVVGLLDNEDESRERLASLLTLSLIRSYAAALRTENITTDFALYVRKICAS